MSKIDYIGELCRMSAMLERCAGCYSGGLRGELEGFKKQADTTAHTVMSAVMSEFVTPLERGDIAASVSALRRAILSTPAVSGGRHGEGCLSLVRAVRECTSALRGRGRGDCALAAYLEASLPPEDCAPAAIKLWHGELCRCYETLLCTLLNSL